jgi:hypothetical protein
VTARAGLVSASAASRVAQLGPISPVAGLPLPATGIAVADGRVVTVVKLGDDRGSRVAILCEVDGDPIALAGAAIVATGWFDPAPGGVVHAGALVQELDVRAIYGELESALWASRALRHAKRRADARGDSERPPSPTMMSPSGESGGTR